MHTERGLCERGVDGEGVRPQMVKKTGQTPRGEKPPRHVAEAMGAIVLDATSGTAGPNAVQHAMNAPSTSLRAVRGTIVYELQRFMLLKSPYVVQLFVHFF